MVDKETAAAEELLSAFQRALRAMSADELAELHAPDAVYEFPLHAPGEPASYRGREEIRAGFGSAWQSSPLRVVEVRTVSVHSSADPEVIVAEQEAILTREDREFVLPFLLVLRVRDGRIVHTRDYTARPVAERLAQGEGAEMTLRLELVAVPVSDVDRAKAFYVERFGFRLDHDLQVHPGLRFVQLTPPGSACSIAIGTGLIDAAPGTAAGLQLVVEDAEQAHAVLRARGVDVSDVQDFPWGRFCFLSDPDGNGWSLQQVLARR